jgi:D-glycero-alpha-D-manno-heptose-7-phosphate kinase
VIIVRAPLRITLGGGGTDVKSYYEKHGGMCIAAAIDKYVYITVHETFVDELIVKYAKIERVTGVDQIEHPLVREAFRESGLHIERLELASMADIPAGTGLGSSSTFTVALIKALHTYAHPGDSLDPRVLAEQACAIEIDKLREPIGKQDQYMAAYGGIRRLQFSDEGYVSPWPVAAGGGTRADLEDGLMLFFTGYQRSTATVLTATNGDPEANLRRLHGVAYATEQAIQDGELDRFGCLLTEQWKLKRKRLARASNSNIDDWIEQGIRAGAAGGKLVGAGGGGFLLFFTDNRHRLRKRMQEIGLPEVRFKFDNEGARVVLQ